MWHPDRFSCRQSAVVRVRSVVRQKLELLYTTSSMLPVFEKPKRGRPPKSEVEKLRDRIWIYAVQLHSSLKTGYSLETAVDPDKVKREAGQVRRPGKWDRYVNGSRGPGQFKGKRDAVAMAEAEFPGTAVWYYSPLWWALELKPKSADDCEAALHRLDINVSELLLTIDSRAGAEPISPRRFDEAMADQLVKIGSFDALAAAVVMARWAEAIASPQLRDLALNCYARLQPAIAAIPELTQFYPHLFTLIDMRCKHWTFVAPNQRMDIVIFWQGFQDRAWNSSDE